MAIEFESVSIDEVKSRLSKRTRTSKWRQTVQDFLDADLDAAKLSSDDDDMKPGSVASGINHALSVAKDAGNPFPVRVKQAQDVDGNKAVYLIRTDRVDLDTATDDDEALATA
jgi:hypothetical protein